MAKKTLNITVKPAKSTAFVRPGMFYNKV